MAPTWARVLWFIFVGWWLGLIWIGISTTLMITIILFPFGAYMISKTWEIMTLKSSPSAVIAEGQRQVENPSGQSGDNGILFSGRDHDTKEAGSYVHYDFDVKQPAILDYRVDSLQGGYINTILTVQDEVERFDYRGDIRILEKGTQMGTDSAEVQARIKPADYSIIVDNTGRQGQNVGEEPVDIEIEYEVRT